MSAHFDWAIHHMSLMLVLLPWLSSMGVALWLGVVLEGRVVVGLSR
jgi:hypothetical protein